MAELEQIKEQIAEAQRTIARAEYERDTALRAREEALANLRALGVESEEEAVARLSSLRYALEEQLMVISTELETLE